MKPSTSSAPLVALAFLCSAGVLACAGPAGPPGASAPAAGGAGDGGSAASAGTGGATGAGTGGVGSQTSGQGQGGSGAADLTFQVTPGQNSRAISPYVYGVNYNGTQGVAQAAMVKAPLVRIGGNDLSEYNWEINATNGGDLEGFSNEALSASPGPGGAVTEVLQTAQANGGAAHVTIPLGDYVAADTMAGDVHSSGSAYLTSRFRKNVAVKGSALSTTPDVTDDSVYQDEFTKWVQSQAGSTPVLFSLDNQPELWSADHTESHPNPSTYADVIARNIAFATMVKNTWPGALVTGYASYGWQGYLNLQNAPDAGANGMFVTYYLDQMQAAETTNGSRLLDYLDIHWWPEAEGAGVRIIGPDATPEIQAARVQAPRSLWDTAFTETSWIATSLQSSGDTIHLIPRAQGWITDHYPGTKLAVSAWYYGGGGDVSGAIATADVLGIFGREGVDMAAVDLSTGDDSYTLGGFQAYLNFDGTGKHFGDTSISATTTDTVGTSIYASTDSSNASSLVIVALNKHTEPQNAIVTIGGSVPYGSCNVYAMDGTSAALVAGAALVATTPGTFRYQMPAMSVTVLEPQP